MHGTTQTNSLDFGQSGGINKQRKIPFGFGQSFETPEDDYSGMNIYSRPSIEKEQYQYYNQHNSLSDPSFFGSVPNNAMGKYMFFYSVLRLIMMTFYCIDLQ